MISHDVTSAIKYSSHILHMGSEIFFGTTEEYVQSDIGKKFVE
jgi:zinc transport system ATP-binding protein